MFIGAHELLAVGTNVRVQGMFGTVTKAEMVNAHPTGVVALHTVLFTERYVRHGFNYKRVALKKPEEYAVNYAFIQVLPDNWRTYTK